MYTHKLDWFLIVFYLYHDNIEHQNPSYPFQKIFYVTESLQKQIEDTFVLIVIYNNQNY